MKKVYLSNNDILSFDFKERVRLKIELCKRYNLMGVNPIEYLTIKSNTDLEMKKSLLNNNLDLLKESDYVIVDITPFRGANCSTTSAFEIGYASALNKPIFAYSSDDRSYINRAINTLPHAIYDEKNGYCDSNKILYEDFGLNELALLQMNFKDIYIHKYSNKESYYNNLSALEGALIQIKKYIKKYD